MTIRRNPRPKRYTIVPNEPLEDPRLDFASKGLLTYLLSKPDNWTINRTHLANQTHGDGETKIRRILKTLEDCRYLKRIRCTNPETGTFEWVSVIYDEPYEQVATIGGFTTGGSSTGGFATGGKPPPLVSTEVVSTEGTTTEVTTTAHQDAQQAGFFDESLFKSPSSKAPSGYTEEFESMWKIYPNNKDKKKGFGKWNATLKKGATVEELTRAATNYSKEMRKEGREARHCKHAATFFGPDEPWREYLVLEVNWKDPRQNIMTDRGPSDTEVDPKELYRRRREQLDG